MVNFKWYLYSPAWGGVGGWMGVVIIIKLKANLSLTGTGLNWNWAWQLSKLCRFDSNWIKKLKENATLGGQTVILGNWTPRMGKDSVVVAMGYLDQFTIASPVKKQVTAMEVRTTTVQNNLPTWLELVEIWENPPMEDDSRKLLKIPILKEN